MEDPIKTASGRAQTIIEQLAPIVFELELTRVKIRALIIQAEKRKEAPPRMLHTELQELEQKKVSEIRDIVVPKNKS